ncbi:MAG: PAS domain-containing protein [Alphaproteobacteria bacterium]
MNSDGSPVEPENRGSTSPASATEAPADGAIGSALGASGPERRKTNRLIAYWERLRGNRQFPSLSDINSAEIHGLWPFCLVIKVADAYPNLRFEYVGSALKESYGLVQQAAISGMSQGETVFGTVVALAYQVLETRVPACDSGLVRNSHGDRVRFRSTVVPLSDDQKTVNVLLGMAGFLETADRVPADPGATAATDG